MNKNNIKDNKQVLSKKVFKEKTTIKKELEKALEENIKINYHLLSKRVGVSVYRVKKYCEKHNINLNEYNLSSLNNTIHNTQKDTEKNINKSKKKIKIQAKDIKIKLNYTESNKIQI